MRSDTPSTRVFDYPWCVGLYVNERNDRFRTWWRPVLFPSKSGNSFWGNGVRICRRRSLVAVSCELSSIRNKFEAERYQKVTDESVS